MRHKGPGHIMRMYSSGPTKLYTARAEDVLRQCRNSFNFADMETRVLGQYAGYDPRNHTGRKL